MASSSSSSASPSPFPSLGLLPSMLPPPISSASSMSSRSPDYMISASDARIEELQKKNAFLEDTVRRLNVELARYESILPNVSKKSSSNSHAIPSSPSSPPLSPVLPSDAASALPPWALNAQYMNPLLVAYDNRIADLESQLRSCHEEVQRMQSNVRGVTAENDRLASELKRVLSTTVQQRHMASSEGNSEGQIPSSSPSSAAAVSASNPNFLLANAATIDDWQELHERIDLLTEENDLLLQQQQEYLAELERMRSEANQREEELRQTAQNASYTKQLLDNTNVAFEKLKKERSKLLKEVERSKQDLYMAMQQHQVAVTQVSEAKNEIEAHAKAIGSYRKSLEELSVRATGDREELTRCSMALTQKAHACDELRQVVQNQMAEIDRLNAVVSKSKQEMNVMEARLAQTQQSEFEAMRKIQETYEIMEAVQLDKDQGSKREENMAAEIERLSDKLKHQSTELKERMRQQFDVIQSSLKKEVVDLQEENRDLEQRMAQIRTELERMTREKKSAEIELERIARSVEREGGGTPASPAVMEDLMQRYQAAQRECDEAQHMYESIRASQKRMQLQFEQERETFGAQISEATKRFLRAEHEANEVKEDRLRLVKEMDTLQRNLHAARLEREKADHAHADHVREIKAENQRIVNELCSKCEEAVDSQQRAVQHAHDIAVTQDKVVNKWKEEYAALKSRSDEIMASLREENRRLSLSNEEMALRTAALSTERNQMSALQEEYELSSSRLRMLLETAERRAAEATAQMSSFLAKESMLLREKKELSYQLDKVLLEKERAERERDTCVKRMRAAESAVSSQATMIAQEYEIAAERDLASSALSQSLRLSQSQQHHRSSSHRPSASSISPPKRLSQSTPSRLSQSSNPYAHESFIASAKANVAEEERAEQERDERLKRKLRKAKLLAKRLEKEAAFSLAAGDNPSFASNPLTLERGPLSNSS